jgi:alpha-beta hydrolase superfamily lysophospholipase
VRRLDLRGHGRPGGRRVYVDAWSTFRDDLGPFVSLVAAGQPALPVFLVGISLGGLIVKLFVETNREEVYGDIAAWTSPRV